MRGSRDRSSVVSAPLADAEAGDVRDIESVPGLSERRVGRSARILKNSRLGFYQHVNSAIATGLGVTGIGTAAAFALWVQPISMLDVWLFLGFGVPILLGVTVGFHRHFTHCSFDAPRRTRVMLAILGSMAGQGPVIFWVALHRMHHEFSDRPGDPHSPNLSGVTFRQRCRGLFHAYIGWTVKHEVPNANHYAADLLRQAEIMRINRLYYVWVALGLALPTLVGALATVSWVGAAEGFVWGGLVRMFAGHNAIWWITSFAHVLGTRDYSSKDLSTNNGWLALPTLGESWHNNHHAFPRAAVVGFEWWQIDISGATIRLLEKAGLAYNVRMPSRAALENRRRRKAPGDAAAHQDRPSRTTRQ
jgi:stearoyl-CoA desaturase (delta-9 desaturase)